MIMSDFETIQCHIDGDILAIKLNRPDKRNSLNEQMVQELNSIFIEFKDNDQIIGVSVTGSGKAFCAGADLLYLQSLDSKSYEENLRDSKNLKEMYWNIYTFPKPTVGLINGPALAGGCGLATVLDIAISTKNAIFGYPEVKIGFVASIVAIFLVQTVGLAKTRELLYTGEMLSAEQAQKIGLVHNVVNESDLQSTSDSIFSQFRQNSPEAIKQTKNLLLGMQGDDVKIWLEKACEFNAKSRQTEDFKEGLRSFLEKRRPIWAKI